ncbi:P-loop containing nucleoside triphosphate hydrolase protein [Trichoderma velutinum]
MDSFALTAPVASMATAIQNDPFYWDPDTLSRELCSQSRLWVRNPAALAAKLAAEDIDGRTLLTYEFLFARKELQEALGITTARSKAGLAEAILGFQANSPGFRSWKKNWLKKRSEASFDEEGGDVKGEIPLTPLVKPYVYASPNINLHGNLVRHETDHEVAANSRPIQDAASFDDLFVESDGDCIMQTTNGDTDRCTKADPARSTASPSLLKLINSPTPAQQSEEQPSKRRRLAPTNLSTKPLADSDSFTLTQAVSLNLVDTVEEQSNTDERPATRIPPNYAYLGEKGRHRRTVLSHADSPGTPRNNHVKGGFAVVSPKYMIPPGKRLATNSIIRKQLIKNSKKEAALKRGDAVVRSATPSNRSESVVDLDGLPDSWDEETQREIDEENAETAVREREQARQFPTERVESILKEEIAAMEARWKETKLPKHNLKAHQIWKTSRRGERIKEKIFKARRDADHYERRIKKLYAEILDNAWQTEREVRTQASVMEQSLSDKLYHTWLLELLEQRDPPPKPSDMPKPKPKLPTAKTLLDPFDDEVLTSSDEDGFIVRDDGDEGDLFMADREPFEDVPQSLPFRPSHIPSDIESDMVIDLTLLDSDEQITDSKSAIQYIDLTSPIKHEMREAGSIAEKSLPAFDLPQEAPPMDHLGSLQFIGEHSPRHWAKQKDRWRLVLCLLWKLTQTRREWILRLVQDNTPEEAWKASIRSYQTNPLAQESDIGKEETKTVAFDVTKLLLSCVQCRQYTDKRIITLDKKDKTKINRAETFFSTFYSFIKEWAPQFPQSSQIFRTDAFDDEIRLDEADEHQLGDTETPSKVRKHVAKEIIQNKEGVALREREMKRAAEIEARREKVRATLANSNALSVDKSRVIINESKEDDQPFIYVNDDIGKLIKDHQINGVRFLWDQIILNAKERKTRQGCLLAHTMGLGKTMQVITFLVAVTEAANSDDDLVRSQIPKELRKSQSLVLCPAGLVDNWLDEILMWSPTGLLGNVFKVESAQKRNERMSIIKTWERDGGVLVVGHKLFERSENDMREILTQSANMVICDEAHVMKNPKTKIHRACQEFRTRSRIALTGSPLSNNVDEYYWMINWVAPNFLGPHEEFRDIYANPIQCGLWHDSTGNEKRKALKMLEVLKLNVAPKVQRATTQCVKHELPAKYEFVIFVEPTPTQKLLYNLYLAEMAPYLADSKQVKVFGASDHLRLICNHPRCFRQKVLELSSKADVPGSSRASATAQLKETDENEDDTDDDCSDKTKAPAITFPQSMISSVLKETSKADNANPALSRKVELLLMILDEARTIGDKVLVFSQSLLTLDYLENLFKEQRRTVCRLDGSTAVFKRQEQIKAFNTGKQEIYLISTGAGGVGLNIYGANRVVIFDFKWNPVTEQQAVGRAYRFGQEKTVYVYQFVVSGAFEEALQNKTVFKMQLASRVVDKKKPVSWGKRVGELLQPIKSKPAKDLSVLKGRDGILDKLIEYAQPGGSIREIISTDTFEEEDPTNELTEQERKDAQELHNMERIRHTNPEKYRMMLDQKQRAEQIRAMAQADMDKIRTGMARVNELIGSMPPLSQPTTGIPGPAQDRTAAPDGDTEPVAQTQAAGVVPPGPQAHMPQFSSSAPLPMTGANTHILTSNAASKLLTSPSNGAARELGQELGSASTAAALAASAGLSLFAQLRSQAKIGFEIELVKMIEAQPEIKDNATDLARKLTEAITMAQKAQGHGFLPDNARWRFLLGHIKNHRRFMLAIVFGNCTATYLATAPEEEIQNRIAIMNDQSEKDFLAQLGRVYETPDPSNLNNIHRPMPQSARATEDAQVMRRAADKRTERRFRLPQRANNAL